MKILPKKLNPELLGLVLNDEVTYVHIIENNQLIYELDNTTEYVERINIDTLIKEIRKWILSFDYELKIRYKKDLISIDLCKDGVSLFEAHAYKDELEAFVIIAEWVAKEKGLLI